MADDSGGGFDDSGGPTFGTGNMSGLDNGDQSSGGWWDSFLNWLKGGNQSSNGGGGGGGVPVGTAAKSAAGGATAIDWAKFLAGVVASRQSGSFKTAPMTPEEAAVMAWAMPMLTNAPDKSTGYPIGVYNAYAPKFDFAAARAGGVGYQPGAGLTADQLAKVLHPGTTTTDTSTSDSSFVPGQARGPVSGRPGGNVGGFLK